MRTFAVALFLAWAAFSCEPVSAGDLAIQAMTFNLRNSAANDGPNRWNLRREMLCDVIRSEAPDFLGVQEAMAPQIQFLEKSLPGYGHVGRSRVVDPSKSEAVPIFFQKDRWTLDAAESGTFWLSDTPDQPGSKSWGNEIPRIVTWGRFVEKSSQGAIYVFNVHLDHLSEPSRARSAELLAERIAKRKHGDPVVVMGDFNCGESSAAIRRLLARPANGQPLLVDSFRALHPDAKKTGTFHGFDGTRAGEKIDFILASPTARFLDAAIVHANENGRYPSDHFPVTAKMAFPAADGEKQ
jgi:endonuclease/exonuclease/phosphatase family metal-dependent hydrolase